MMVFLPDLWFIFKWNSFLWISISDHLLFMLAISSIGKLRRERIFHPVQRQTSTQLDCKNAQIRKKLSTLCYRRRKSSLELMPKEGPCSGSRNWIRQKACYYIEPKIKRSLRQVMSQKLVYFPLDSHYFFNKIKFILAKPNHSQNSEMVCPWRCIWI